VLLTECESKTTIFEEMFEDLQCSLRTTQPSTSAPNRIYTGGKSEGCSKVSSQTHWAIPRGPQLAHSPLVGMGLRVTASTLYVPSYAPSVGPIRCRKHWRNPRWQRRNHPRRGSMAFSPRKRASRTFGHVKSWPTTDASEVRVQGFAGWKAGMTHILARDLNPRSTSAGQEVRVPVTVVECPKMRILGVRGYEMTPYGKQARAKSGQKPTKIADAFPELFKRVLSERSRCRQAHGEPMQADLCEVRLIVATQPHTLASVPTRFLT
jgi:hypothetical protein